MWFIAAYSVKQLINDMISWRYKKSLFLKTHNYFINNTQEQHSQNVTSGKI
jgi:hypothetical protein